MLYLNSIENAEASPTEKKYTICHEEVPPMRNIPELAPSMELLAQWESKEISWEIFRKKFIEEMKTEYLNGEMSRLKGLAKYALANDVTLHSPEPSGERTYRSILEGIINQIWESQGLTKHVINLARAAGPKDNTAHHDPKMFAEVIAAKDKETQLLIENAELKKDIQSFQTESHNKDKKNDELEKRIDQLEEKINTHEATTNDLRQTLSEKQEIISNQKNKIQSLQQQIDNPETTIGDLRRTLSEKDGKIQSLNNAIGERDSENDRLNRINGQLQEQINTHETTIGDLRQTLSKKDGEIQSLNDEYKELQGKFHSYYNQQIRDIAVKATRDNPVVFDIDFNSLIIDSNLPITLRTWLEKALKINQNSQSDLYHLIREHTDFKAEYTLDGKFDKYDVPLADVIRTQRNLIAHPERMDERTKLARVYCCFFAAALLAPKLSQAKHHTKPKSDNAEAHYDRGVIYRKNDDCDRAIAEYTKAIKLKPNYVEAYRNRGTAYYHKGDYVSAIKDYTEAIDLRPNYAEAYYDRGTAYYRKGNYDRAIAEYIKAIKLKPNYANAYHSRGHAYKKKGDHALAQADFDKAKRLGK